MVGVLVGVLAWVSPVRADPAVRSSATALGVQGTGLLSVAAPRAAATQPPDSGEHREEPVSRTAGALALEALGRAEAEASLEPRIPTPHLPELEERARRRHLSETRNNARGFSEALDVTLRKDGVALLQATSLRAVAVARCESNQALFDSEFKVEGLTVLGQAVPPDRANVSVDVGSQTTMSVKQGEVARLPGGGISVNALHVTIPTLDVDLVFAHSDVAMPTPCRTGGGEAGPTRLGFKVAAEGPPAPVTKRPAPLAATGGPRWLLPLGGASVVLACTVLALIRRGRPAAAVARDRRRARSAGHSRSQP